MPLTISRFGDYCEVKEIKEAIDGTDSGEAIQYFLNRGEYAKASDLLRLVMLIKYGGVYMDFD